MCSNELCPQQYPCKWIYKKKNKYKVNIKWGISLLGSVLPYKYLFLSNIQVDAYYIGIISQNGNIWKDNQITFFSGLFEILPK